VVRESRLLDAITCLAKTQNCRRLKTRFIASHMPGRASLIFRR
jgi:hypothetical protein